MTSPAARLLAYACLALSMALVGSYVALSKPLAATFPVFLLAWLRFAIGAIAMLRWLRKPASEPPMSARTRLLVFLESFLGNFLFTICMIQGVSLTGTVAAGVIMASIPAVIALMSRWFLREPINAQTGVAIACSMLGIGLLALAPDTATGIAETRSASDALLGKLLIFIAVVCEASYAVIGKRLTGVMGPKRISAIINLWGLILTTPIGLYLALDFPFADVPGPIWPLLVFYGLAASMWSVWLWMTGLLSVPAAQAGVFTVMLPVTAAAVGIVFLGESLSGIQAVAFAIALAGLLLATMPSRAGRTAGH